MASKFEVAVWGMRAGWDTAADAERLMQEAAEQYADAKHMLAAATSGSVNEKIDTSRGRLGQVLEALQQAYAHLEGAREEFDAYLDEIGAGGVGPPATGDPAPTKQAEPEPPPFEPFKHNHEREEVMRRIGWPTKPGTDDDVHARGILYLDDGTAWGSEEDPLWAGRDGLASERTDLKPEFMDPQMRTTWHIEGHAAAYMVKHGKKRAILYINQSVCGIEQPQHPKRCGRNARHLLPPGYKLYVHSVLKDGSVRITPHRGTGKAIKDD